MRLTNSLTTRIRSFFLIDFGRSARKGAACWCCHKRISEDSAVFRTPLLGFQREAPQSSRTECVTRPRRAERREPHVRGARRRRSSRAYDFGPRGNGARTSAASSSAKTLHSTISSSVISSSSRRRSNSANLAPKRMRIGGILNHPSAPAAMARNERCVKAGTVAMATCRLSKPRCAFEGGQATPRWALRVIEHNTARRSR